MVQSSLSSIVLGIMPLHPHSFPEPQIISLSGPNQRRPDDQCRLSPSIGNIVNPKTTWYIPWLASISEAKRTSLLHTSSHLGNTKQMVTDANRIDSAQTSKKTDDDDTQPVGILPTSSKGRSCCQRRNDSGSKSSLQALPTARRTPFTTGVRTPFSSLSDSSTFPSSSVFGFLTHNSLDVLLCLCCRWTPSSKP